MKKIKNDKKVIVAMSGGVDSSVAAALLKEAGFDVIGVFMKFWTPPKEDETVCFYNRCCSPESEKRARLVAEKLGIPFYVFNFEKEFKKKVVDYFLKEFKLGLTPNPCVVCNKEIKFGLLFKKLQSLDADYIATGHYVRLEKGRLLESKDKTKDQSYFLWKLDQKILKRALFPVGDYRKKEIKKLAKKFDLPVVDIPESQEICFIHTTVSDFLKRHLKVNPGKIIDTQRKTVGKHQGLWFYTIGQRKGIELAGGPYYVLNKNMKKNLLIVTKKERDLYRKELIAKNVNWVTDKTLKLPLKIKARPHTKRGQSAKGGKINEVSPRYGVRARIRYGHKSVSATVKRHGKMYKVIFSRYQRAITPGQSVVFYRNQEVLGGGIII